MNPEKLGEAMNSISDRHLAEAALDCCVTSDDRLSDPYPAEATSTRRRWASAIAAAAMLAIIICVSIVLPGANLAPMEIPGETIPDVPAPTAGKLEMSPLQPGNVELFGLVSKPTYPEMAAYPQDNSDAEQYDLWRASQKAQYSQPSGYADNLKNFWLQSLPLLLDTGEENAACSPLNVYCALAMLAECTGGNSRAQILELLCAESVEALREQAGYVWNAHYRFDGLSTSVLGSSLWLDEALKYNPDTVSILSNSHYASVFRGNLGSSEMNKALQDWLNDQTGGLLKDQVQNQSMEDNTVLGLATTIFYRADWQNSFSEEKSTLRTFHTPNGNTEVSFMNRTISQGVYYFGEDYRAVSLPLQDGSQMWLVLPSQGKTPEDVLRSGNAAAMIFTGNGLESMPAQINLSLPRFDVCAQTNLTPVLKGLGITDVFSERTADFTAILPNEPGVFLGKANHAARVAIDEEGVIAAAYTIMHMYGTSLPMLPEEQIDFILDRPFLFIVESPDGLPTFAGVVNTPTQTAAATQAPDEPQPTPQEGTLSPQELDRYAHLFRVNRDENGIASIPLYNTSLLTTFDAPQNADLSVLFANGFQAAPALSSDEEAYLQSQGVDTNYDIVRIPVKEADTALRDLFGIGWEDCSGVGMERLVVSADGSCYYRVMGGAMVAENIIFHRGTRSSDGTVSLYYSIGGNAPTNVVTLRDTVSGVQILSNLPAQ